MNKIQKEALKMKPILFNTSMTCAILEGRKTVTRRVVKPQPFDVQQDKNAPCWCGHFISETGKVLIDKLPYRPGDTMYVRETWNYGYCDTTDFEFQVNETFFEELTPGTQKDSFLFPRYFYRTEGLDGIVGMKWRPSIHMPREAARIFLRVMDVRVERLQNITPEQAMKEGVIDPAHRPFILYEEVGQLERYARNNVFPQLWDSTVKPADRALYGWDANPWVWVIEFERISREEALTDA